MTTKIKVKDKKAYWIYLVLEKHKRDIFKKGSNKVGKYVDFHIEIDGKTKEFTYKEFKKLLGF